MKFNSEIQGLRAIAVIGVIIYHSKISVLNHNFMSGGYIGVDIFFVISGYLIGRILLKQLLFQKKLYFKVFLERRIKRIFPLLLFVTFASFLPALFLIPDSSTKDFLISSIASLTFVSNFYFLFTSFDYGNANQLLKPLLHTWSLSVEMQFYILFPFFFFIVNKFLNGRYFLWIIVFLTLSYLISIIIFLKSPYLNFYFLPSRGWEFLLGAVTAYLHLKKSFNKYSFTSHSELVTNLSLLIILFSFIFLDTSFLYNLHLKIIPLVATCCIIFFSEYKINNNKILSFSFMALTGKISYSLYLWHFPIFSFFRIYKGSALNLVEVFFCIFVTFVFSIFTYHIVEKKFQKKDSLNFIYISSILIFFSSFCLLYSVHKTYEPLPFRGIYDQNKNDCFGSRCVFNNQYKNKVYLIGDSTTAPLIWHLKKVSMSQNFQLITYIKGGCILAPGFDKYKIGDKKKDPSCNNRYFDKILNDINLNPNSMVIIGGNFNEYLDKTLSHNDIYKPSKETKYKNLAVSVSKTIEKLSKFNHVLLIYPAPLLNNYKILKTSKKLRKFNIKNISISEYLRFNAPVINLFSNINNNKIFKISVQDIFCKNNDNYCYIGDDSASYYWDAFHISKYGALKIANKIEMIIKKIH